MGNGRIEQGGKSLESVIDNFWHNKSVIITGGHGFLGRHLVKKLEEKGCRPFVPTSKVYDLRYPFYINELLSGENIDILFHLAANVGGIGYNLERPYDLFYDNAMMGIGLIHSAIQHKVKKFVQIGTVCSYPDVTRVPFNEDDIWYGYPENSNAPYGIAKRVLLTQLEAASVQYNFNGIYLILANMYGPGDNFDENKSHVIAALVKKFVEAKKENKPSVEVWGDGYSTRDFLFVEDAVNAIVKATESYNDWQPLNIGTGQEISIENLAIHIKNAVGYKGKIVWNSSMPRGQLTRKLNVSRAKTKLKWKAEKSFSEGLKQTIEWYEKEYLNAKN